MSQQTKTWHKRRSNIHKVFRDVLFHGDDFIESKQSIVQYWHPQWYTLLRLSGMWMPIKASGKKFSLQLMFKVSCLSNWRDWDSLRSNNTVGVNTNTVMKTLSFGTMKRNQICHTQRRPFFVTESCFFKLYIKLMDWCESRKMSLKSRDCGKERNKLCNWQLLQFILFYTLFYIVQIYECDRTHCTYPSSWPFYRFLALVTDNLLFKVTSEYSKIFKKPIAESHQRPQWSREVLLLPSLHVLSHLYNKIVLWNLPADTKQWEA